VSKQSNGFKKTFAECINEDGGAVCPYDPQHIIYHASGPEWALRVLAGHRKACVRKTEAERNEWTRYYLTTGRGRWGR